MARGLQQRLRALTTALLGWRCGVTTFRSGPSSVQTSPPILLGMQLHVGHNTAPRGLAGVLSGEAFGQQRRACPSPALRRQVRPAVESWTPSGTPFAPPATARCRWWHWNKSVTISRSTKERLEPRGAEGLAEPPQVFLGSTLGCHHRHARARSTTEQMSGFPLVRPRRRIR